MIDSAKHRLLVGNKSSRNPLPLTADHIREGRENFAHYCFACHGLDGQGTGVPFFDGISPPIPALTSESVQAYSDGQLFWVIRNGLWPSGMPAARGILNDEEMWSMVIYIRNLPPAGSLGEPPAYTGDCRQLAPTAAGPGPRGRSLPKPGRRYFLSRLIVDRRPLSCLSLGEGGRVSYSHRSRPPRVSSCRSLFASFPVRVTGFLCLPNKLPSQNASDLIGKWALPL